MAEASILTPDWQQYPGAAGLRYAGVAADAGSTELGATLYELEPGGMMPPYHLHHGNAELLVVLAGTPALRTPEGTRELDEGAVISFPRGPDGAHRIFNRSDANAQFLIFSTMHYPDVAEYPDTGAVLTVTGPREGRAFPAEGEGPYAEVMGAAVAKALEIEAADAG